MQHKTFYQKSVLIAILVMVMLALFVAPATVSAAGIETVPIPANILNVVAAIALGFASLLGVSALIAALVNLLKVIKVVKDGTSAQWAAALNLAAFIALVAFGVFRADLAMDILDGYAGQIAMIILFILGFITQMTGSKPAHDQLAAASVPLIGKSFSDSDGA